MSKRLQFDGEKSPSRGPKMAIIAWYLFCGAGAIWLTFSTPMELNRGGNPGRQVALLACVAIYVARAAHTLFVFVKRRIPWWEAAWGRHHRMRTLLLSAWRPSRPATNRTGRLDWNTPLYRRIVHRHCVRALAPRLEGPLREPGSPLHGRPIPIQPAYQLLCRLAAVRWMRCADATAVDGYRAHRHESQFRTHDYSGPRRLPRGALRQ